MPSNPSDNTPPRGPDSSNSGSNGARNGAANNTTNSAAKMAAGLVERGFPIFADMDFTVGGSSALSDAFLQFALSDDLACAEFMRCCTAGDVVRLPLAVVRPADPSLALLCAQKVQMVLFMLSEEIRDTLSRGPFSLRHLAKATNPAQEHVAIDSLGLNASQESGALDLSLPSESKADAAPLLGGLDLDGEGPDRPGAHDAKGR